jgi:hypothetical protein
VSTDLNHSYEQILTEFHEQLESAKNTAHKELYHATIVRLDAIADYSQASPPPRVTKRKSAVRLLIRALRRASALVRAGLNRRLNRSAVSANPRPLGISEASITIIDQPQREVSPRAAGSFFIPPSSPDEGP